MKNAAINWNEIPDIITKDQLYRICHISKSTARYLLQSGKIPCYYTGKQTRCYKIKKEDVIAYLEDRKVFPGSLLPHRKGGIRATMTIQTGGIQVSRRKSCEDICDEYYADLFSQLSKMC